MGSDTITLEYDGPVAILSNNRPDRHNAANNEMDARPGSCSPLAELHAKEGLRCVVWRQRQVLRRAATPRNSASVPRTSPDLEFIERGHAGTQLFFSMPCPIVASR
jgi:hypothetical protein